MQGRLVALLCQRVGGRYAGWRRSWWFRGL